MRILKKILIGLGALIVLLFIISIFLPSTVHVERTVEIKAKAPAIYSLVNTPSTYDRWMPWNKIDPGMKKQFFGPASGVGAGYSWESDNREVGNGSLTITESRPDFVKSFMDFKENGTGTGGFILNEENDKTRVTWTMDSKFEGNFFKAAIGKYMGLFMDKMVGPSFEQGLNDIKKIAESQP